MPLDPQTRVLLDVLASLNIPELGTVPIEQSRLDGAQRRAALPPGPDAEVSDHRMPSAWGDRLLRLYKPLDDRGPTRTGLPALVWFHGGGWVLGSVQESDADCRMLAAGSGCAVVSVEYPLAPEHPFPAALEVCYGALQWVCAHAGELGIDPGRVAVGGDSAGGNLAASTARWARDRGGPPVAFQLLVYPVTDITRFDRPSYLANADGYYLTRQSMMWFADQYVPRLEARADPNVSPLLAEDLAGLAPAHVITAEFDPLRDEGDAYAARLAKAGVPVGHQVYAGMIHGFFSMHAFIDGGKRLHADLASALRAALAG